MADAAVVVCCKGLKNQITSRALMISGARNDLQKLDDDIMLLKSFLVDLESAQVELSTELDLERQIKELVNDVQDIRESWSIHRESNRNTWHRSDRIHVIYGLARKMSSIRDGRVDPLLRRIHAYKDIQIPGKHSVEVNKVPSLELNKEKEHFVGLLHEAEALISLLMEETDELDVISIVGMPGIGKTTLARKIYQSEIIRSKFPTRIWVDHLLHRNNKDLYLCIFKELIKQDRNEFKKLEILLDIPEGLCNNESYINILDDFIMNNTVNEHQLIHAVRTCLEKRKFMLVMDDVWTAATLESIKRFLPTTGKVLVTSCNNRVGGKKSHVLRFLNESESWDLLQLEVFGELGKCPEILKPAGESIAKNCDGLPLAVSVVASSLMVPFSKDEGREQTGKLWMMTEKLWEKVSENVTMYITEYGTQHRVLERVELSYNRLAQCLQECFLYLGVFPQGLDIPVPTLIRLWIAEGLVQESWGMTLEETAERNLYDLFSKNMVMVGKVYPNGQIKSCRLHKLMYVFCKHKAAEKEFYHEIKMAKGEVPDSTPMNLNPIHRRLCIDSCLSEFLSSRPKGPCVRSILCLRKQDEVLHPKENSAVKKVFKLLKIFECRAVEFTEFPRMLSKLLNLKYISLSCDGNAVIIPETISLLCFLETLVVETQSPSLQLRANIWRMSRLQHLLTHAAIVLAIREKGEAGNNLQTLTRLAPAYTEEVLTRAPNLKTLGIRGRLADLPSPVSLRELEHLENLKLVNESGAGIQLQPELFPPNLKWLTLSGTYLEWKSMSILGKIEGLEILKLKNNAFVGESWTSTDANGFRGLVYLSIRTTNLVSWEASVDSFPCLKCLVLKKCENLCTIPSTLAKSLDTLDVEKVSESAVECCNEIKRAIARRQGQYNV